MRAWFTIVDETVRGGVRWAWAGPAWVPLWVRRLALWVLNG